MAGSFIRETFGDVDNSDLARKVESRPAYVPHELLRICKVF